MRLGKFYFFLHLLYIGGVTSGVTFTYNGFHHANLSLSGAAHVTSNGILSITKPISKLYGHVLYPLPLQFMEAQPNNEGNSTVVSFSTNFVFNIKPKYPGLGGHGFAFVLMATKEPKNCQASQFLGLPSITSMVEFSTKLLAVEFDTVQDFELHDINDNHVGIDISSLISNISQSAAYFLNSTTKKSLVLKSGDRFQAWIDYSNQGKLINVTIAPLGILRPYQPLISFPVDLSSVLDDYMYVGFSASTGVLSADHNVIGWSFSIGGTAPNLDLSVLPSIGKPEKIAHKKGFIIGIILASLTVLICLVISGFLFRRRLNKEDEILEDWEVEYGARRFKYSELVAATEGFGETSFIGSGGFGRVYKGVIPRTGLEVAIKRIGHESRQGMREFVAEITSMGRLRHRNLVQLHGWCRRQDDLFLVYEHVPNGSLDNLLSYNPKEKTNILTWDQRYKILIGIAQALLYLHEECELLVVHRDIKPSNVLIDADLNPKLGDFGLARTSGHGMGPQTTRIVGTLGYLAPEFTSTGKATTSTDVYSYGALMLEVASGRRPIEPQRNAQEVVLVDWVSGLHLQGEILVAVDPMLEEYKTGEATLVLSIGLLCCHPEPDSRPTMRTVLHVLLGEASLPLPPPNIHLEYSDTLTSDGSDVYADGSNPSSMSTTFSSSGKKASDTRTSRVVTF